jgi:hypothetical protein
MVVDLWMRLARERVELQPIATYFNSVAGLAGDGRGSCRSWPSSELLSRSVHDELTQCAPHEHQILPTLVRTEDKGDFWSEWYPVTP